MFKPKLNIFAGLGHLMRRFTPPPEPPPVSVSRYRPRLPKLKNLVTGRYGSPEIQRHLIRMTNWQLSQWQRAGRPKDEKELKRFAELPHCPPS